MLNAEGQFLPSAAHELAAANKFQGRWLLVSGAFGDAPAGCIFKSQSPKPSHDPSTNKKAADGRDVVSFAGCTVGRLPFDGQLAAAWADDPGGEPIKALQKKTLAIKNLWPYLYQVSLPPDPLVHGGRPSCLLFATKDATTGQALARAAQGQPAAPVPAAEAVVGLAREKLMKKSTVPQPKRCM